MGETRKARLEKFSAIDLYPVVTQQFCAGRNSLDVCRDILEGGAKIIQLREKEMDRAALLTLAENVRLMTRRVGALMIINDHVDVAVAVEADGVHLGQDDMPVEKARMMAAELLIGVSTHTMAEADTAQQSDADYFNMGPVFATQTKALTMPPVGLEMVTQIANAATKPFSVMGGIHLQNISQVLDAGARRIAMVTEVTQAPDVAEKVRYLRKIIQSHK